MTAKFKIGDTVRLLDERGLKVKDKGALWQVYEIEATPHGSFFWIKPAYNYDPKNENHKLLLKASGIELIIRDNKIVKKLPIRIVFEYEDEICEVTGEKAEALNNQIDGMASFLQNRGMNPFDRNPVEWTKTLK